MAATLDSSVYKRTFFGILNVDGHFWTPLVFDDEKKARKHIRDFWMGDPKEVEQISGAFTIVPVRVQLTDISTTLHPGTPS